jgi:hypothetical protein
MEAAQARLVYAVIKQTRNDHLPIVVVNDSSALIFVERLEVHAISGGDPVVIGAEPGGPAVIFPQRGRFRQDPSATCRLWRTPSRLTTG